MDLTEIKKVVKEARRQDEEEEKEQNPFKWAVMFLLALMLLVGFIFGYFSGEYQAIYLLERAKDVGVVFLP